MHPVIPLLGQTRIRKTVGIDLGTTNSVISLLDPTDSQLLIGQDEQGHRTFPSLVGYDSHAGKLVAGRAAHHSPQEVLPLASVKRYMGLDKVFTVGPEQVSPQQASACVLQLLRDMLARTLKEPRYLLDSAIITIPAYFNHNQIEATRQAGELAGFEVVELLHEPTAAAIYYSWVENHADATYLVYDLGGGTFDVSIIRRRLGDYEVLSVSGDPFLGGDDFDRLLASHLLEVGTWRWRSDGQDADARADLPRLFDLTTPQGSTNFAHLIAVAESIKCQLTSNSPVERYIPQLLAVGQAASLSGCDPGQAGSLSYGERALSLEVTVDRPTFQRLIRDKIDRTIDCCREALARARERAGLSLADIDYVILVGGSSRVPLVRDTVRAAFCNPDLPEHVRSLEPLLHEPDLCVAYGAALRAATHGTHYLFPRESGVRSQESGIRSQDSEGCALELHVTSPACTTETRYLAAGRVYFLTPDSCPLTPATDSCLEGGSVRIRSLASGLIDEAFLDTRGTFAQDLELQPETDNPLEWTVCDPDGREMARVLTTVRHRAGGPLLGQGVLPTQIITKPLAIEVLNRGRQRIKQVVAPIGATLPNTFLCTCRTQDQAGRIVVPIFEENRVVKQMVLEDLDRTLPVGSPVEVEFAIDVKHNIEVRVRLRTAAGERSTSATVEAPPPAQRPTRAEIDEVQRQLDELLQQFSGRIRTRVKARASGVLQDLLEALSYEDEPRAIQRMAELRDLVGQLEASRGSVLDPPWPRFSQLVRQCLDLAAQVADSTGRDRDELFEHIHAQERYAEQAYEEHNQALYRECRENLEKYAGYLTQMARNALPRPPARPPRPPEEEAREEVEQFRGYLSRVWKQVRQRNRQDLEKRMTELAGQARGFSSRIKTEPVSVIRDARRLATEIEKIEAQLDGGPSTGPTSSSDNAGLLEGSD
jgi:molecular chaperone DnaK